jgi:hypothetical protein
MIGFNRRFEPNFVALKAALAMAEAATQSVKTGLPVTLASVLG